MTPSPPPDDSPQEDPAAFYHIQGSTFGPVPRDHIASLWQNGSLPDDTLVFLHESSTWEPVTVVFSNLSKPGTPASPATPARSRKLQETKPRPDFRPAEASLESKNEKQAGEQSPRARLWQNAFIICLLVATAAIGAVVFWASQKFSETDSLHSRLQSLESHLAEKDTTIRRLRDSTRPRLEPNEIQGRFILNSNRSTAGAKVALFRRAEMEKFIQQTLSSAPPENDEAATARSLTENLPFPIASTATDSEGFYRLEIPEPGEFILHTNMIGPASKPLVWFLSFSPDDPRHGPIHFTEENASSLISPDLVILKAR